MPIIAPNIIAKLGYLENTHTDIENTDMDSHVFHVCVFHVDQCFTHVCVLCMSVFYACQCFMHVSFLCMSVFYACQFFMHVSAVCVSVVYACQLFMHVSVLCMSVFCACQCFNACHCFTRVMSVL